MAVTVVALWPKPADEAAFEEHYAGVHMPLARKLPGLKSAETYKTMGDAQFYRVATLHFDSMEAMGAAMSGDEGKALAADTEQLGGCTVLIAQDD